jgi:hypothetical protein
MKLQLVALFTFALCLQTDLHSMHPTRGQLTVPQTRDEQVAHDLAIADIKAVHEKQATTSAETKKAADAKASTDQKAELNAEIFKNLPDELQPNIFQFMPIPTACSMALLEHRELKIQHDNITAFAQMSPHQVATASQDGTIKIWDITTGKQIFELHEEHAIDSLIKIDGTTIAFGLTNGTIKLWNIATNQLIATCIGSGETRHELRVCSLLKFSDRYIISASADAVVNAWDISDLAQPRCMPLPGAFQLASSLSKISDTRIIFETLNPKPILILDLSDIEHPKQDVLPMDGSITSCMPISSSVIACGSFNYPAAVVNLIDLSTKKTTTVLNHQPFVYNSRIEVKPLSSDTFIACHGYGLKIWNIKDPQQPTCIATIRRGHQCEHTIRLSDTSFACAVDNTLHIYQPNAQATAELDSLNFQDRLRFTTLASRLSNRYVGDPLRLDDIEYTLFKKMPTAIKNALMDNFGFFIYEESADVADHKE